MLISKNGSFMSQRRVPKMALIKQSYENNRIVLSAPGKDDISFSIDIPSKTVECRLWSNPLKLNVYGGEIAAWLSDFLEEDGIDLVNFGNKIAERNKPEMDFNRFMLISEATLAELNSRLDIKVSMRNFRPNFTSKGGNAFDEVNIFKIIYLFNIA